MTRLTQQGGRRWPMLLSLPLMIVAQGAAAQPAADEVAAARLDYIAGSYEAALEVLRPAAEAGDPIAQNILGDAYDTGKGVTRDSDIALDWWEKAAAQDFDKALYNLGRRYQPSDIATAMAYYERSVATGYSPAMVVLGRIFEFGAVDGGADAEKAAELYAQAADLGNMNAMNSLGLMYIEARGVDEDLTHAFDLFATAAAGGNPEAIGNLGTMYAYGYAVAPDPLASMALYEMAAELGGGQAAINLAFDLIEGAQSYRDPALGWAWCLVGTQRLSGEDRAAAEDDCAYLADRLDAETIAAGAALAPGLTE